MRDKIIIILLLVTLLVILADDYKVRKENTKLTKENEALWDNYYMNVSNYEGYEYYE